jgi:hypothetical protein
VVDPLSGAFSALTDLSPVTATVVRFMVGVQHVPSALAAFGAADPAAHRQDLKGFDLDGVGG